MRKTDYIPPIDFGYSRMKVTLKLNTLTMGKLIENGSKWLSTHTIIYVDSIYDKELLINKVLFKTKAEFYIEFTKDENEYIIDIYHQPNQINEVILYIKQLNKINYGN